MDYCNDDNCMINDIIQMDNCNGSIDIVTVFTAT